MTAAGNGGPARRTWPAWESELLVVRAADRPGLVRAVDEAIALARERARAPLASFARSLLRRAPEGRACLAIVAANLDEFARKAAHALKKLSDPDCRRIQDRSGIFYTADPLYAPGTVGLLFPGEGCQYPDMLRELCLHFPEVRHEFDLVDLACRLVDDDFTPSAHIFGGPLRGREGTLWNMGAAVEAVSAADTGMMRLFQALAVPVGAVVGHSSGEFAALEMAGVLRFQNDVDHVALIRDGYRNIRALERRSDIPAGILISVGGIDQEEVQAVLDTHPGRVLLAMHNCPHQFVLCSEPAIVDAIAKALSARGGLVQTLPFNRPYHTPWFEPALDGLNELFAGRALHPPAVPLYSCATADRFPADPAGIRELCVVQWTRRVRFDETIRKMHDDGIRLFVDIGPRGNLAAFASDILKGRPHEAIAANRHLRSSLTQLHFALGQLVAHGVPARLEYLHERRGTAALEDAAPAAVPATTVRLAPRLPAPRLDGLETLTSAPAPDRVPATGQAPAPRAAQAPLAARAALAGQAPLAAAAPPAGEPPAPADALLPDPMAAYFDTMEKFIETQQKLVSRFLRDAEKSRP
jgi:acyl transferase domain-containing protein